MAIVVACQQSLREKMEAKVLAAKNSSVALVREPRFQTVALGGGSGIVVLGAFGGSAGCATGLVAGAVVGAVPALLTFGLSIPAGAVVGASVGTCTGATAGGLSGLLGGMGAANAIYVYRVEIGDGYLHIQAKCSEKMVYMKLKTTSTANATQKLALVKAGEVHTHVNKLADKIKGRAAKVKMQAMEVASDRKVQVSVASAAAGGVTLGTTGGLLGSAAGAAAGLIPALFTFGLSIPAGFVLGGGAGLMVGGTVGATAGGSAGYGVYTYRGNIKAGSEKVWGKATGCADYVKDGAASVRTKIIGGGTGSTA